MFLVPTFQLHFDNPILDGLMTIGKCTSDSTKNNDVRIILPDLRLWMYEKKQRKTKISFTPAHRTTITATTKNGGVTYLLFSFLFL